MLVATTVISIATTEDAFANSINHATSETSKCGNSFISTDVDCQNTVSQVQGKRNTVALATEQRFAEEENGQAQDCSTCFSDLGIKELRDIATVLAVDGRITPPGDPMDLDREQIIAAICEAFGSVHWTFALS